MANNSSQIISHIISRVDNKIIELEKRETINVVMRIDEVVPFLKGVLELAKDDQSTRKFDLIEDKTGSCTITYTADGETISSGANKLVYGDTLVITVVAATGYTITKLKVNGQDYTSGTQIFVDKDITLEVVSTLNTYNLVVTPAEHTSITVTKGGDEIEAGTNVISYGDQLLISASADEGYLVSALTINGVDYVESQTITVSGNVTVSTTATEVVQTPTEVTQ